LDPASAPAPQPATSARTRVAGVDDDGDTSHEFAARGLHATLGFVEQPSEFVIGQVGLETVFGGLADVVEGHERLGQAVALVPDQARHVLARLRDEEKQHVGALYYDEAPSTCSHHPLPSQMRGSNKADVSVANIEVVDKGTKPRLPLVPDVKFHPGVGIVAS